MHCGRAALSELARAFPHHGGGDARRSHARSVMRLAPQCREPEVRTTLRRAWMRTSGSKSGTTGMELLVSLSIPKFVRVGRHCLRTSEAGTLAAWLPSR